MKKAPSSCQECGENKTVLTQVSNTVEIIYFATFSSLVFSKEFAEKGQSIINNNINFFISFLIYI